MLIRCARQEVFGITTFEVISEITHRLMVSEAFQKGPISKPRAEDLRQRPGVVQQMTDYWLQVSQIFSLNLIIVATEESILRRAQGIRDAHGLLTLDSVLVGTMEEYEVRRLASHDHDFDRIDTLTVYHPSDIP